MRIRRSETLELVRRALALAAVLTIAGCGKDAPHPAMVRPPPIVAVATAVSRDVPDYLDEIGRCTARETVSIVARVTGPITTIHFADGADVKPGDVLFTIDPRPYQAALDQAGADLAQAKARLELAKLDLPRYERLMQIKGTPAETLDEKRSAVDVAAAQVSSNQATVDTARLNLEFCTIRSPIEGRIGHHLADVGTIVTGNAGPALAVIERLDPIYADFSVTEGDFADVQRDARAGVLKVEVRLPDAVDGARTGDLTFIDNTVAEGTGTVMLRATLRNADHHLWPGRFVKVRLIKRRISGAVLVPLQAVSNAARGTFVYVVKPDLSADLRPVTLGQRQDDMVVVEKGIHAGERVVTLGQMGVIPNKKVRIETPGSASGAASQGPPASPTNRPAGRDAASPAADHKS